MVPSRFVVLDTLPLNDNGKVDRRALPPPGEVGHPERPVVSDAVSDLERALTTAWERVLDVSPIGAEDNFFDLGGDSLLAARLLAELEAGLGRTLLPGMLLEAPTVRELAQALGTIRPSSATGSVIALQPGGALPPLWCVPPHRGDVLAYVNLARRLGSEQPVYALQAPPPGARPLRMEETAALHLEDLRRVQPAGPYHLAGYCFGGVVAFEMAQQLTRRGEDVAFLALLDLTPADFPTLVRPGALASYLARPGASKSPWARAGRLVASLHKRAGRERWAYLGTTGAAYVSQGLDEAAWMVAVGGHRLLGRATPRRLWTTERFSRFAFASYAPEPFAGAVTLLLSEGTTASYSQTPGLDWTGLARGTITVRLVPGEGGAMLKEPHVRVLADALVASLRERRPGSALA
jgi:thioesterase domain-containing protein